MCVYVCVDEVRSTTHYAKKKNFIHMDHTHMGKHLPITLIAPISTAYTNSQMTYLSVRSC
jgi:hypothetical protein